MGEGKRMAGKRKREGAIDRRVARNKRRARETIRLLREQVTRAQQLLDELLAKKEEEMKENVAEKGREEEEDGYTLDNDPSGAQCSRPRKSNERNHEKWQRYKEIFSLYYAENGDLKMPRSYEHQGVKIGRILSNIRWLGDWVKDNPQRKQWLLERGVILTYDSGLCLSDTTRAEKWQRYKEIFSLYYTENGDLNMPHSYVYQGVKIGSVLNGIRHKGCFVRDNAPRKLWLLEKGVSFTYDSLNSVSEEKWRRYREIFSLYFAENGDLNIPRSFEFQGVKIGNILKSIRVQGCF